MEQILRSTDVFPAINIPLAESAHHELLDLIASCRNPREAEVLRLRLNGATQVDIAQELGYSQSGVSRRLYDLMERAGFEHLGLRLRGRRERSIPPESGDSGQPSDLRASLRVARHDRRAYPHGRRRSRCWCAR